MMYVWLALALLSFGTVGVVSRYLLKQAFFHFVAYLSIPVFIIVVCFYGKV
jgi:hypothetical protein